MITIIKRGIERTFVMTCSMCDSVFSYQNEDTTVTTQTVYMNFARREVTTRYITCPVCGHVEEVPSIKQEYKCE